MREVTREHIGAISNSPINATVDTQALSLDDPAALDRIETLLRYHHDDIELNRNKYLILLARGELLKGWDHYDWHLKYKPKVSYDTFPVPPDDGSSLYGKHIIVWGEQGVGDQVFIAGMFNEAIRDAASVTILCAHRLVPIYRRSFPQAIVHRPGERPTDRLAAWEFDYQLSIADLGKRYRRDLSFKSDAPYLLSDLRKTTRLRERYRRFGSKIVGLSWYSKNSVLGETKSALLTELEPLLRTPGLTFVSLQYGDTKEEIADAEKRFGIQILNDCTFNQLTDMDTFVSQVDAMDYVVTTSNTTAHIAGAIGKRGSVLLPARSLGLVWYWHTEISKSPWYPSLSLVRQQFREEWGSVASVAANDVRESIL